MKLFHKSEPAGPKTHPFEEGLRRIYREEGIPEGERLARHLRDLPKYRFFACPNRCAPMIYVGDGTPPACPTCGKAVQERPMDSYAVLAEARNDLAAEAHVLFALECFHAGNAARAEAVLSRAIGLNPNHESAYHDRSEVRIALGDNAGALKDCDQAIRMNPKAADSFLNRSAAKANLGDYQGGYQDADVALKLGIKFPVAHFNRGMCLMYLGEERRAAADLEQFLKLAPMDGRASMVKDMLRRMKS